MSPCSTNNLTSGSRACQLPASAQARSASVSPRSTNSSFSRKVAGGCTPGSRLRNFKERLLCVMICCHIIARISRRKQYRDEEEPCMHRRGVSSRTRKLVIGGAAAALLGSALAVGTGMGQAAEQGNAGATSGNISALVPALGFSPGDPNATADRVGPTGVKVPGRCPPTQAQVNAQVALKNANLPSGTDLESRIQRFERTLSAIQDLKCPASSTTLLGRLKSLTALRGNADSDNILRDLDLNETPAG